mmetsp:Transcript_9972/g.31675  ORF Transcript_9972/g.31675 Transcript_9972/m.31675 type:complete len:116 (-) Transcript_9972:26-373(-)
MALWRHLCLAAATLASRAGTLGLAGPPSAAFAPHPAVPGGLAAPAPLPLVAQLLHEARATNERVRSDLQDLSSALARASAANMEAINDRAGPPLAVEAVAPAPAAKTPATFPALR